MVSPDKLSGVLAIKDLFLVAHFFQFLSFVALNFSVIFHHTKIQFIFCVCVYVPAGEESSLSIILSLPRRRHFVNGGRREASFYLDNISRASIYIYTLF